MLEDITAPAPRFLLRFLLIDRLLQKHRISDSVFEKGGEIGPGLGDISHYLLRKKQVVNIDLYEDSQDARKILKDRFSENQQVVIKHRFEKCQRQYQFLLCCEVIEHIENDVEFITAIGDSMVQDGVFVGSVPSYMSKWQAVDELAGHFRRYERDELHSKLSASGFEVETIECYGFPLINLLYPLRQYYYSKKLNKGQSQSKREATAKSGISRGLAMLFNKKLVYSIARFSFLFQKIPFFSRWGDGFVFVCRKK